MKFVVLEQVSTTASLGLTTPLYSVVFNTMTQLLLAKEKAAFGSSDKCEYSIRGIYWRNGRSPKGKIDVELL
jgi:hypothetical protein